MDRLNYLFVPTEEALALKELGFNQPCFGWRIYNATKNAWTNVMWKHILSNYLTNDPKHLDNPTYEQAFAYLRTEYGLHAQIGLYQYNLNAWIVEVFVLGKYKESVFGYTSYKSYNEAQFAALKKLIDLSKHQKRCTTGKQP